MNPNFTPVGQENGRSLRILNNAIFAASLTIGAAAFADSSAMHAFGVPDLPIRGEIPEPFDVFNSGMSIAMGVALAERKIDRTRVTERHTLPSLLNLANDTTRSPELRNSASFIASHSRHDILIPAAVVGSVYVMMGEIGSEVLHAIARYKGTEIVSLGHFDPTDVVLGVGAALTYTGVMSKRITNTAKSLEVEREETLALSHDNLKVTPQFYTGKSKPKPDKAKVARLAPTGRTTPKGTQPQPKKRK